MCQMCSHWTWDISPCAFSLRAGSKSLHVSRGIFLLDICEAMDCLSIQSCKTHL